MELKKNILISRHSKILNMPLAFFDLLWEKPKKLVSSFCTAWMLGHHFGTYGLVTMSHHEGLDSRKMAFMDRVQNGKQVSWFCLDHSRARNGRVIRKQLKQTCKTKKREAT